ncbi:MAG: MFS transporter [Sphingomonas sp.]|uniref:MFS transporter n=1 Tax=Sphingomonas sp. TaxID=28214 RepID=UPI001ACA74B9|nr:MFS transporter [Sphingomonas sp.]MBN8808871.1 MFS transporter [Sphingomonas sp.]
MTPSGPSRRSTGFLLVYALANAGGVIGFLPLLSLLLPIKIEAVAGEARLGLFTATVIAGSIAASISNVVAGWLSDRSVAAGRGRRGWVAGGAVATAVSYGGIAMATTPTAIVVATVAFQAALNTALGPLVAIMADEVPDEQKSFTGGLLALSNPVASGVLALVMSLGPASEAARLALVVAAFAICIAPILATRTHLLPAEPNAPPRAALRRDLAATWAARLLVQLAGAVLSLYLLYYFESIAPAEPRADLAASVSTLLTVGFVVALPIAILFGRLSDRLDRRKPFLLIAAAVTALGLSAMAVAHDWRAGAIGFVLYAVGVGVFLPLQNAFSMQLLPDPRHRGRDLGLLNLTNTLPSLLGPLLTWLLATPRDFGTLLLVLAVLAMVGGLLLLGVRNRR